jgi:serine/threonine-protein kinase ATR
LAALQLGRSNALVIWQVFGAAFGKQRNAGADENPFVTLEAFMQTLVHKSSVPGVPESVLQALGQLARNLHAPPELTALVLKRFLDELTDGSKTTSVVAYDEIHEIAHVRFGQDADRRKRDSSAVKQLFDSVKDELYTGIAMQWFQHDAPGRIRKRVDQVAELLEVKSVDFADEIVQIALPSLVATRAEAPLRNLARYQKKNLGMLMMEPQEMQSKILASGLLMGSSSEFIPFVARCIEGSQEDVVDLLAKISWSFVVQEAVWEMGKDEPLAEAPKTRALSCLQYLIDNVSVFSSVEDILQDQLPLILEHLNGYLHGWQQNRKDGPRECQNGLHALRSLQHVIEIMRSKIVKFLPTITSTLKVVLSHDGLQEAALAAWASLVTSVPTKSFGPYLSQIVGHLLPFLPRFQKAVLHVLQYLIVDNGNHVKQHFRDLPFLPPNAELEAVNHCIKTETGDLDVVARLRQLLRSMENESVMVRTPAVAQLQLELRNRWPEIAGLVRGATETVHPVIDELVTVLKRGCIDLHPDVRRLSMECFGELGAIDPTKFPKDDKSATESTARLQMTQLVALLLNDYLVRVVKAAKSPVEHDKAAFAIQELLKLNCVSTVTAQRYRPGKVQRRSTNGEDLWGLLRDSTRNLVHPYLKTKYLIGRADGLSTTVFHGFADSVPRNHQKWVKDWAYLLTSKLDDRKEMECFRVCRAVIKRDVDTAVLVLPYLVWEIVWQGTSTAYASALQHEMVALLQLEATPDTKQVVESQLTLFSLLDRLQSWARDERDTLNAQLQGRARNRGENRERFDGLQRVEHILNAIPKESMAKAARQCKAYQRSLVNYEEYLRAKQTQTGRFELDADETFILQQIYRGLNEADGLAGVAALRSGRSTSLEETIVDHEAAGRWIDATTCYNVLIQQRKSGKTLTRQNIGILQKDSELHHGLMTCMRALGHFQTVLAHARGMIKVSGRQEEADEQAGFVEKGIEHAAAAAWRLGQWETIREIEHHQSTDRGKLDVCIASVLRRLDNREGMSVSATDIEGDIQRVRRRIAPAMSAACMESYDRAYPFIAELHVLQELESICRAELVDLPAGQRPALQNRVRESWDHRLHLTQPDLRFREPILAVRRAFLQHSMTPVVQHEIGDTWLQLARTARMEGQLDTAVGAMLQPAAKSCGPRFHIEKAQLLWKQGNLHYAVMELEGQVERAERNAKIIRTSHDKTTHAEVELLLAEYLEQTGQQHTDKVRARYETVTALQPEWDKGYFALAQYLDKMYSEAKKRQSYAPPTNKKQKTGSDQPRSKSPHELYVRQIITNYGQALKHGHSYLFQCLPRILTLWFEFGDHVEQLEDSPGTVGTRTGPATAQREKHQMTGLLSQVIALIDRYYGEIPSYQWFTALPQLISRTGHKHGDTQGLIKKIIVDMAVEHTLQAAWLVGPATHTHNRTRATFAKGIVNEAITKLNKEKKNKQNGQLLKEACIFIDALISLCDQKLEKSARTMSIQEFPDLAKKFRKFQQDSSRQIVPTQVAMSVVMPTAAVRSHQEQHTHRTKSIHADSEQRHEPFVNAHVRIDSVENQLAVMASLQKPRRVTFQGSDGNNYDFLCKVEDKGDMRKDSRLMEFNTMVNRLLQENDDSRQRALNLRTFAVHPLNEHCGLIEWVPDTDTLRQILFRLCGKMDTKKISADFNKSEKPGPGSATERRVCQHVYCLVGPQRLSLRCTACHRSSGWRVH